MIGGNTVALLQRSINNKNSLGETVSTKETVKKIRGFLDMASGDSNYLNLNSKTIESTHIFICDYVEIVDHSRSLTMLIQNKEYDVKYIDDPMGLHEHLEIYLKYRGF